MRRLTQKNSWNSSLAQDIGLLLLRLGVGLPMLIHHGITHLTHFNQEASLFLPLFGLDPRTTLILVIGAEVGAAFSIIVGLFTRIASLMLAITIAVAFVVVHSASFTGQQSGYISFLYLIGSAALGIMGPGRFAWDPQLNF
ncbi:MAG: DoxX family protein [Prosthecobacter sp.]